MAIGAPERLAELEVRLNQLEAALATRFPDLLPKPPQPAPEPPPEPPAEPSMEPPQPPAA